MRLKDVSRPRKVLEPASIKSSGLSFLIETENGNNTLVKSGRTSSNHGWELKGCPRCRGDVFLESEEGDLLGHCLNCGYVGMVTVQ